MKIIILFQPIDGGTNVLLNRAKEWLINNGSEIIDSNDYEELKKNTIDLVLLPTSEMHRLPKFWKQKIKIRSILIWAMGSLAFQGALINQMNNSFIYKIITLPIRYVANKLLMSITNCN